MLRPFNTAGGQVRREYPHGCGAAGVRAFYTYNPLQSPAEYYLSTKTINKDINIFRLAQGILGSDPVDRNHSTSKIKLFA